MFLKEFKAQKTPIDGKKFTNTIVSMKKLGIKLEKEQEIELIEKIWPQVKFEDKLSVLSRCFKTTLAICKFKNSKKFCEKCL